MKDRAAKTEVEGRYPTDTTEPGEYRQKTHKTEEVG